MSKNERQQTLLLLAVFSPVLLVAVVLFLLAAAVYLPLRFGYWLILRVWFERTLGRVDKRVLLVTSRSPHWQEYIDSNWLPRLEPHVVVLNWSERSTWGRRPPLEVRLFRYYAGSRDFNPMVILFPRGGRAQVIRLFQAFRDLKHGKVSSLTKAEVQLFTFREKLGLQRLTPA